ncbi:SDR family oxidoreductase [Arthrobacter sp. H5]|uniref:SDR family oxidoreductase n=1 Tax=Arthrobacter sp. H5 TaxID=1267973 RepID=UPI0020A6CFE6|nr:SDR family oxidoreductase [Arthrobacter sp. H5]
MLTVGLAAEVAAQGIRVNGVSPGSTNTGLHAAAGMPDRVSRLNHTIPMGRGAEPHEIAAAVSWLLSAEAGYVTGANVPVSGGR